MSFFSCTKKSACRVLSEMTYFRKKGRMYYENRLKPAVVPNLPPPPRIIRRVHILLFFTHPCHPTNTLPLIFTIHFAVQYVRVEHVWFSIIIIVYDWMIPSLTHILHHPAIRIRKHRMGYPRGVRWHACTPPPLAPFPGSLALVHVTQRQSSNPERRANIAPSLQTSANGFRCYPRLLRTAAASYFLNMGTW